MTIMDGINLGIGFMLAPAALILAIVLLSVALGLISLPFIYLFKRFNKKTKGVKQCL